MRKVSRMYLSGMVNPQMVTLITPSNCPLKLALPHFKKYLTFKKGTIVISRVVIVRLIFKLLRKRLNILRFNKEVHMMAIQQTYENNKEMKVPKLSVIRL